jgi:hypothetical protein
MLTIETRDLDTMNWGRKGALLMLAVVVLWTAMPVSACLLAMRTTGQHSCCSAMNMTVPCAPAGTTANRSCCQAGRQNPAVTPVAQSSSEHSQRLALMPAGANLQAPTSQSAACRNALEAPPPKFSPGGISILRI